MAERSAPGAGALGALSAIGRTPLVQLGAIVPDGAAEVWVKLEGGNPTGSYKDRMALSVIESALKRGDVRPGDTLVEYTGGSTGMALALVAGVYGLGFTAVFSDAFSRSKQQSMEAFGATVLVEHSENGLITTPLVERMKARAYTLAEQPGHYYTDQFGSPDVVAGYVPMGVEIAESLGCDFDVFCHAVGTGGALMGTLQGMTEAGASPSVIALEPAQAPLLTERRAGAHHVEGIAVFTDPPFLDRSRLDDVRAVDQERAFETCRRLARTEGIFAGASSGLNIAAAIEVAVELGSGHRVVAIACDTGLKYVGEQPYE